MVQKGDQWGAVGGDTSHWGAEGNPPSWPQLQQHSSGLCWMPPMGYEAQGLGYSQ